MAAAPAGKVTLVHVETGAVHEHWPVDARGMLATGEYTLVDDAVVAEAPAVVVTQLPPEHSAGVPLNVTTRSDAKPAAPVVLPSDSKPSKGGK